MAGSADNGQPDGGDHSGGGPLVERLEGSLTDGGSLAGEGEAARRFGAARGSQTPAVPPSAMPQTPPPPPED